MENESGSPTAQLNVHDKCSTVWNVCSLPHLAFKPTGVITEGKYVLQGKESEWLNCWPSVCGVTPLKANISSTGSIGYPYRQLYCNFHVCKVRTGCNTFNSPLRSISATHSVQNNIPSRSDLSYSNILVHLGISKMKIAFLYQKKLWL